MRCDGCGHDNQPGAKFCSECGAALQRACTACAATLSPTAKFCDQCGQRVDGVPATADAPAAPAGGAVRKQVTAVFADLVGSTGFGERLDPEAVRAALAPYFELLQSTIDDHDGTVVKFTGDGMLALFGVPDIAEDDALRAVASGLELQRRFRAFADTVLDRHGVELGLRVGINSGELVIADGDADMVGDVLNTAARLESACDPGSVLVGEDTWRLTRSVVEYEVLGEVHVKGKAEPLATFRVLDDERTIADDIPFVGRGVELEQLLSAFGDARDSPMAQLVTVIGAPGVGKTRLAAELRGAVDARSFDLRFERRGSTTFTPIAQLLRDVTDGTIDGVTRLFTGHPDAGRVVPILGSFVGHGDVRSTEESFWAVRRLLEHLAASEPLIVVVDDIQWAEPLFWDLLDHLVEWATAPVLIIALARPELRDLRPELTQPGRRVTAAISLEGLDVEATRELAARLLDTDDLPDELMERIPASTEGNPLFVRELVQMLVDDGTLARDGDRWTLTIDADAIEVPPTILSLLATRVERLPDDERQVVELASVIGTDFDRGTLAAIAPDDITNRLGTLLDRLRRKDLIEPSGAWAGDHPVYRFHHVLIRDAAYRRLLKGRRADLHELVGRHFDTDEATAETDVVVAHHYEQTVQYRAELGTLDDSTKQLGHLAVTRLQRAADEALDREDLLAAGGYARRALALVETDDPVRDELLVVACEALLSSGDAAGATPMVRELHDRSSDNRLAAWADCFRAQRWQLTDAERLGEAAGLAEDAAGRLDALDDQSGVAKARLVRASCLARLGQVGTAEEELDLALGAARTAGDRRRTVAVLGAAPLAALWGPSPVARAGGRCLDVLRLLRITSASPAVEATSIRCQAMLEALRSRTDSAREKLDASRTTAKDLGDRQGLFETELFAGFIELWNHHPAAAEPHLRAAREGLGGLGIGADAGQATARLAQALLARGDVDHADQLAQEAVDAAGQNLQTFIAGRVALAEVRAAQGDHDQARRLIREALDTAQNTDLTLDRILALFAAKRIATAAGDPAAAARYARGAAELLASKGVSNETDETTTDTRAVDAVDPATDEVPADVASGLAVWEAIRRGDREAATALFAPGARLELRTRLSAGVRFTVDEQLDNLVSAAEQGLDLRLLGIVDRRGPDLRLSKAAFVGNGTVSERYVVTQVVDGLIATSVSFDDSQLDDAQAELDRLATNAVADEAAARARFEEVASGSTINPSNEASRLSGSSRVVRSGDPTQVDALFADDSPLRNAAVRDHGEPTVAMVNTPPFDRDRWLGLVHDDYTAEMRRPSAGTVFVLDRMAMAAQMESVAEWGGRVEYQILAIRGDELYLSWIDVVVGDDHSERLVLAEVVDGKASCQINFGVEQREEAFEELDRRWVERGGRVDPVVHRLRWAMSRGPFDEYADLYAPEFVCIDHRPLGFGTRTRDEYLTSTEPLVGNVTVHGATDYLAVDDEVSLFRTRFTSVVDGSVWDCYVLQEHDGHRITRWEQFALADRERALARYAECVASVEPVDPDTHLDDEPAARRHHDQLADRLPFVGEVGRQAAVAAPVTRLRRDGNRAWEVLSGFRDAGRDRQRKYELLHPDFVDTPHYRMSSGEQLDRDRFIELHFDPIDAAERWHDELELIAWRGDHLCLAHLVMAFDENVIEFHIVVETDDDRITFLDRFDHTQLNDALDELDRRWVEQGGPVEHTLAPGRIRRAFAAVDVEQLRTCVTDEFVAFDHRPLGVGVRDADQWAESMRPIMAEDGSVIPIWRQWARCEEHIGLYQLDLRASDGSAWDIWILQIAADDRLLHTELFSHDQFELALARFDELRPDASRFGNPSDRPTRGERQAALRTAIETGDREALAALARDDMVFDVHRHNTGSPSGGRLEWCNSAMSWSRVGLTNRPVVLAAPGDLFLLARWTFASTDGDEIVMSSVLGFDEDDLVVYNGVWDGDDLPAALAELARRTAPDAVSRLAGAADAPPGGPGQVSELPPIENAATLLVDGWTQAVLAGGEIDLERWFDPDFVMAGRRASAPHFDGGADDFVEMDSFWHEAGRDSLHNRTIAIRDDHLCLVESSVTTAAGDEASFLFLCELGPSGRGHRSTAYDTKQLAEALDELDRRWANTPERRLVAETSIAVRAGFSAKDEARLAATFADGAVVVDHRPIGFGGLTAARWMASLEPMFADPVEMVTYTAAFVREDRHVTLSRQRAVDAASGAQWDSLLIEVFGADGRERLEWFADDDLTRALDRFDELIAESATKKDDVPAFENAASRLAAALAEYPLAGTTSQYDQFFEPDFVWAGRRASAPHIDGGVEILRDFVSFWHERELAMMTTRPVALRDDHLALVEWTTTSAAGDTNVQICLHELSPSGRFVRVTVYDDKQLGEALDELDRKWVESGGPEHLARNWALFRSAMADPNGGSFEEMHHRDFVDVDHRRLGKGTRRAVEYRRMASDLSVAGAVPWPVRLLAVSDDVALAEVEMVANDGDLEWRFLAVSQYRNGQLYRNESFDLDDVGEARARFDELVAESSARITGLPPLENAATRASQGWAQDAVSGTAADRLGRFDPDVVFAGRRASAPHVDGGPEALEAIAQFWQEVGVAAMTPRPIAVRGDDLTLEEWTTATGAGDEFVLLVVEQVGRSGLLTRAAAFDPGQLGEALDLLDDWWEESGGPAEPIAIWRASRRAFAVEGLDLGELPFADDFVTHDHRPLGLGTRNLDQFVESAHFITPSDFVQRRHFAIAGNVVFSEIEFVRLEDGFSWHALHVARIEDGLVREVHVFDPEQLDEAQARFDELTTTHPPPDETLAPEFRAGAQRGGLATSVPSSRDHPAWETAGRFEEALFAGDRERVDEMLHPDYEYTSKVPMLSLTDGDAELGVAGYHEGASDGITLDRELVATRGPDLYLGRYLVEVDGYESLRYLVCRTQDGLLRSDAWYGEGQLHDAFDELDRLAIELGAGPTRLIESHARIRRATRTGDRKGLRAELADDFVAVDHRPLGFGTRSIEDMIESMTSAASDRPVAAVRHYLAHTDDTALYEVTFHGEHDDFTIETLGINQMGEAGHVVWETFDPDDLDAARARFEELIAPMWAAPVDGLMRNRAVRIAEELGRRHMSAVGFAAAAEHHVADDFELLDRRRTAQQFAVDVSDVEESHRSWNERGLVAEPVELIAVRGDDLLLARGRLAGDGDLIEFLSIVETDGADSIRRIIVFDPDRFDEAIVELDRRWGANGGPPMATEAATRFVAALTEGTVDDLRAVLTDDFVAVDHRPLGMGTRNRDEYVETNRHFIGRVRTYAEVQVAWADHVVLSRVVFELRDSGDVLVDGFCVLAFADGRTSRLEVFDDLDAARARFDELAATRPRPIENAANRAIDEIDSADVVDPAAGQGDDTV